MCGRRCGALLAALVAAPSVAGAQTAVRADEHLVLEYHTDNGNTDRVGLRFPTTIGTSSPRVEYDDHDDDHYAALIQRLTLTGNAQNLTASAELNGEGFYSSPDPKHENDARLDRITVEYVLGDVTVTAGDFHRQLGRGIVLSLRKIDELGMDTTLQGGRLAFAPEDHELDVFAGRTNTSAFDTPTEHHVPEANDVVAGGGWTWRAHEELHLGTYAYTQRMRKSLSVDAGPDHTSATGAFFELPDVADLLAIYGEVDWQGRKSGEIRYQGQAAYLTMDLNAAGFSALAEGILLDDILVRGSEVSGSPVPFEYNQPPTLERLDQEFEPNQNVVGGRLRLAYAFLEGDLSPYVSMMVRRNEPDADKPLDQYHGYGGVDWSYQNGTSRLGASGGYRQHRQDARQGKSMKHAEVDWVQDLPGAQVFHFTANEELRRTDQGDEYVRGSTIVGLERHGLGGVSVELGNDSQNPERRELFLAGIVSWEVADWLTTRTTMGSQRGGIKCVGGVCRDFPAFSGLKIEAAARHDLL